MKSRELNLLKELSDPFQDFINDGEICLFYRGGKPYELEFKNDTSIGIVVSKFNTELINLPFLEFVKNRLLDLPRLAKQIIKSINSKNDKKKISPIDGPIKVEDVDSNTSVEAIISQLINPPVFKTALIQLMAAAGQGKSVLLDNVALQLASNYGSDKNPPLVLNIDLLGRYVGTIEDAIAGSLNNTYMFPLSQRDVVFCLKNDWLSLALDGFDELVARVGAKDAFQKLTELIDQIEGHGTIIISARETFFQTHQIEHSRQSYLIPKTGDYEIKNAHLLNWQDCHAIKLFSQIQKTLGTSLKSKPEGDFEKIKNLFSGDEKIIKSPFFLSKLAELLYQGTKLFDQYSSGKEFQNLERIKFVIDKYIEREANEKWVDRHGNAILKEDDHAKLLGFVAEEVIRSSTNRLALEELKLCAELALSESKLSSDTIDIIKNKISIHAVFEIWDGQLRFSHIKFLYYYLSYRLLERIKTKMFEDFWAIYEDWELPEEVLTWLKWLVQKETNLNRKEVLACLQELLRATHGSILKNNLSNLMILLLNGAKDIDVEIENALLTGDDLNGVHISKVTFKNSAFCQIDLCNTNLESIQFIGCQFTQLKVSHTCKFSNLTVDKTTRIESILLNGKNRECEPFFDPSLINDALSKSGFSFASSLDEVQNNRDVDQKIVNDVAKMVKKSNKYYYFSVEELEAEDIGKNARKIAKIGLDTGVLVEKQITHRTLVRFDVDRHELMKGSLRNVDCKKINKFWETLSES